ncbi:MAG: hypothetical protein H6510_14445 [Acidobacteria bacterium]|nr:hypothetical protein [Acidobacteriota bacterium]MCB9399010.1 hypothetical protein [Acidobacteriota bacterium]
MQNRQEIWDLLNSEIQRWYPNLVAHYTTPAPDLDLPIAICEFFENIPSNDTIWSVQDRLLKPDHFFTENGHRVFYQENQNVTCWGYAEKSREKDPPVFLRSPDTPQKWMLDAPRLSLFFLRTFYQNLKFAAHLPCLVGYANPLFRNWLWQNFPELPFGRCQWPGFPSVLLTGKDLVIEFEEANEDEGYVYLTAQTQVCFQECLAWSRRFGFVPDNN